LQVLLAKSASLSIIQVSIGTALSSGICAVRGAMLFGAGGTRLLKNLIFLREKSTLRQIPAPHDHFAQVEAILSKTRM
jgi:hypothetical protein